MKAQKKSPEAMAVAQGAQDTAQKPYANASLAVAGVAGGWLITPKEAKAGLSYRTGLAQSGSRFRNQEHQTFESGRVARRKLARMLAKKLKRGVKP